MYLYKITLIRQQNFIIENMGFPYNFVGATIGRPLQLPEFQTKNQCFICTKQISNLWFNQIPAGDQWSPLQNKQKIHCFKS